MRIWIVLALTLAVAGPVRAARIVGVAAKTEPQPAPEINQLRSRHLPKFVDALSADVTRFEVDWESSADDRGPLTVEILVRAEPARTAPHVPYVKTFEKPEPGRRVTSITLPAGQPVDAWSVRILQGKRVLAEQSSPTWE